MLRGNGALSFNIIQEQLELMTINKLGYLPSLYDIYNKFGITFICVTYNLTQNKTEHLSYKNYPNLSCIQAIKMSSNFPIIFEIMNIMVIYI